MFDYFKYISNFYKISLEKIANSKKKLSTPIFLFNLSIALLSAYLNGLFNDIFNKLKATNFSYEAIITASIYFLLTLAISLILSFSINRCSNKFNKTLSKAAQQNKFIAKWINKKSFHKSNQKNKTGIPLSLIISNFVVITTIHNALFQNFFNTIYQVTSVNFNLWFLSSPITIYFTSYLFILPQLLLVIYITYIKLWSKIAVKLKLN